MKQTGGGKSANLPALMYNKTSKKHTNATSVKTDIINAAAVTTAATNTTLATADATNQATGKPAATNKRSVKPAAADAMPDKADVVKIAIDLHAADAVVKVQLDGSVPKPAQKISIADFPAWVAKLIARYPQAKFYSCYEAGPCGYVLHRALVAMDVTNYVIAPVAMNGNRKTDKRDASALCQKLAAYVGGNTDAFSVIYVPTPEEEAVRAKLRHRYTTKCEQKSAAARGRSYLLTAGFHVKGKWWGKNRWAALKPKLPAELQDRLEDVRSECEFLQTRLRRLTKEVDQMAIDQNMLIPRGLGVLTAVHLNAEILNWNRFKGRRAVSSYTGLCPGEHSSGTKQRQGSIDRCGNRHVRRLLVEAVWRLAMWQPNYPPLQMLRESKSSRERKRAVVAIARRLAVDLWRINTGRSTAEKLGLICQSAQSTRTRRPTKAAIAAAFAATIPAKTADATAPAAAATSTQAHAAAPGTETTATPEATAHPAPTTPRQSSYCRQDTPAQPPAATATTNP